MHKSPAHPPTAQAQHAKRLPGAGDYEATRFAMTRPNSYIAQGVAGLYRDHAIPAIGT